MYNKCLCVFLKQYEYHMRGRIHVFTIIHYNIHLKYTLLGCASPVDVVYERLLHLDIELERDKLRGVGCKCVSFTCKRLLASPAICSKKSQDISCLKRRQETSSRIERLFG